MKKVLKPEQRLIVAADFQPKPGNNWFWVRKQVMDLVDKLAGTGVCIKVNSALRAAGQELVNMIHSRGLNVFADYKFYDVGDTNKTDGKILHVVSPELVTVACVAGLDALVALKAELLDSEVLGVTVPTSLKEADTQRMFGCSVMDAVLRFADIAKDAGLDGLISSAKEVPVLRERFGALFSLNTPAIRPLWSIVPGDGQNPERIVTPTKAIEAGADCIVVGRPIIQANDPREAVLRIIEEIAAAAG